MYSRQDNTASNLLVPGFASTLAIPIPHLRSVLPHLSYSYFMDPSDAAFSSVEFLEALSRFRASASSHPANSIPVESCSAPKIARTYESPSCSTFSSSEPTLTNVKNEALEPSSPPSLFQRQLSAPLLDVKADSETGCQPDLGNRDGWDRSDSLLRVSSTVSTAHFDPSNDFQDLELKSEQESNSSSQPVTQDQIGGRDVGPIPNENISDSFEQNMYQEAHQGYVRSIGLKAKNKTRDLDEYFNRLRPKLQQLLTSELDAHPAMGLRCWIVTEAKYENVMTDEVYRGFLSIEAKTILNSFQIPEIIDQIQKETKLRHENFLREKSNLRSKQILQTDVNISNYDPLSNHGDGGGTFKELPLFLKNKRAITNVVNKDNQCFKWSVLAALHPVKEHGYRVSSYKAYENDLNFNGLEFPIKPKDVALFERQNRISINLYSFHGEDGVDRFPYYLSPFTFEDQIDLLYFNNHYAYISDFNRLMSDICHGHYKKLLQKVFFTLPLPSCFGET